MEYVALFAFGIILTFCIAVMYPVLSHYFLFRTNLARSQFDQVRLINMEDLIHKLWAENELVKCMILPSSSYNEVRSSYSACESMCHLATELCGVGGGGGGGGGMFGPCYARWK